MTSTMSAPLIRIGIAGASGFLGGALVRAARAAGHSVIIFARDTSDLTGIKDLVSEKHIFRAKTSIDWINAVADSGIDVLINCAGRVQTDHSADDLAPLIDSNVKLIAALLEGLSIANGPMRVVSVGTYLEHAATGALRPNSLYAATKQAAAALEKYYATLRPLRSVTIKPSVIYGPQERRKRLMRVLIDSATEGSRIALSPGEQVIDFVHVSDVAEALLMASARVMGGTAPLDETYFALSGEARTLKAHVLEIERILERQIPIDWAARPYKATEVLTPFLNGPSLPGWRAKVSFAEGIREMAAQAETC